MKNAAITAIPTTPTNRATKKANTSPTQTQQRMERLREVTLIRIAVSDVGDSKKALVAAIRAAGLPGNPTNIARVQELRDDFDAACRHRRLNHANAKAAKTISALPCPSGGPAIRLPLGTPATRLTELSNRSVTGTPNKRFVIEPGRHQIHGGFRRYDNRGRQHH